MSICKYNRRAEQRKSVEQQIIHIVKKRSKSFLREGVRKLMKSLKHDYFIIGIKVGRHTLFNVLREYRMLTLRKKHSVRTTNFLASFL